MCASVAPACLHDGHREKADWKDAEIRVSCFLVALQAEEAARLAEQQKRALATHTRDEMQMQLAERRQLELLAQVRRIATVLPVHVCG